jgi:hypothetical protein
MRWFNFGCLTGSSSTVTKKDIRCLCAFFRAPFTGMLEQTVLFFGLLLASMLKLPFFPFILVKALTCDHGLMPPRRILQPQASVSSELHMVPKLSSQPGATEVYFQPSNYSVVCGRSKLSSTVTRLS